MKEHEIVYRDPRQLKGYARNTRLHSDAQIERIKASIREFGFTTPVLLMGDGETIGAGHARVRAAIDEKLDRIPTITLGELSETQWRAYVIADNQLALEGAGASWDFKLLQVEIGELKFDFGNLKLGFSDAEMAQLTYSPSVGTEWQGMPEFLHQDKTAFRSLVVHFKDQKAVNAFAKAIKQQITEKTRFVWYPSIEIETYADKQYKAK